MFAHALAWIANRDAPPLDSLLHSRDLARLIDQAAPQLEAAD